MVIPITTAIGGLTPTIMFIPGMGMVMEGTMVADIIQEEPITTLIIEQGQTGKVAWEDEMLEIRHHTEGQT